MGNRKGEWTGQGAAKDGIGRMGSGQKGEQTEKGWTKIEHV